MRMRVFVVLLIVILAAVFFVYYRPTVEVTWSGGTVSLLRRASPPRLVLRG